MTYMNVSYRVLVGNVYNIKMFLWYIEHGKYYKVIKEIGLKQHNYACINNERQIYIEHKYTQIHFIITLRTQSVYMYILLNQEAICITL